MRALKANEVDVRVGTVGAKTQLSRKRKPNKGILRKETKW